MAGPYHDENPARRVELVVAAQRPRHVPVPLLDEDGVGARVALLELGEEAGDQRPGRHPSQVEAEAFSAAEPLPEVAEELAQLRPAHRCGEAAERHLDRPVDQEELDAPLARRRDAGQHVAPGRHVDDAAEVALEEAADQGEEVAAEADDADEGERVTGPLPLEEGLEADAVQLDGHRVGRELTGQALDAARRLRGDMAGGDDPIPHGARRRSQSFKKLPPIRAAMGYEELLERAKAQLPEDVEESSRFEVPKVKGHLQGSRTVINNWFEIAKTLDRKPEHLLKYVQKELATPGEIIKQSVIFGSKLSASRINEKIGQYANEYVFCDACGKPETKLSKEAGAIIMTCQACGARNPVRSRI